MGSISVQGKGYATAKPDVVTLSFSVESKARDYADCLDNLNGHTAALRQDLQASGADCAELKTTDFHVGVEHRREKGRYIFEGYSASHRLQIKLPVNKEMLNRVLGTIAQGHSGAEIQIYFSAKDTEGLRQQALAEAVRIARLSAQSLARSAGVKLGKLESIAHGWDEIRVSGPAYGVLCERAPDYAVDIDPKDISVNENVTLVYEFEE
ncbi:MAG: SIMPL domain-containing protein [Clostridia bacterium]|nr:SIMPL domain-containing protein [Clostridia bacterium]